jgi:hypothetical protein
VRDPGVGVATVFESVVPDLAMERKRTMGKSASHPEGIIAI